MRSYKLLTVWGIPIRVNTSLLLFLPILAWLIGSGGQIELYAALIERFTGVGFDLARLRAGSTPWLIGVVAAVGLFASVTVHELGHSWVALRYGLEIESITLWILGGLASLKSFPKEWDREFWIAIAGPVSSVLVAGVCYGGALLAPSSSHAGRFVLGWLAVTNVTLAAFNLLPAFPMDGGRILRALLARSRPYGTATRLAARVGVGFAFLFAIVAVLNFQIILLLLALFIYGAATTESKAVLLDELLDGVTVGDIVTREPATVDAGTTVEAFGRQLLQDRQPIHLVVAADGSPVGVVTLADLRGAKRADHAALTVRDIARDVPRVDAAADAFDTLVALQGPGGLDAIVERDGALVGLLTEADYAHAMTIQRGFRSGVGG
jgi:Zn-dependent protease/CBS domain-containing protein